MCAYLVFVKGTIEMKHLLASLRKLEKKHNPIRATQSLTEGGGGRVIIANTPVLRNGICHQYSNTFEILILTFKT